MSTDIDGCSVLPPADALPSDTPVSEGHTAATAHELHVRRTAWVVSTCCSWSGDGPEGCTAVIVLLVLLEDLEGGGGGRGGEGRGVR